MRTIKAEPQTGVITQLEMRFAPNGRAIASFRLDDISCEAWDTLAETIASDYDDGCIVTVKGRETRRQWHDRKGVLRTRYTFNVTGIKNGDGT